MCPVGPREGFRRVSEGTVMSELTKPVVEVPEGARPPS